MLKKLQCLPLLLLLFFTIFSCTQSSMLSDDEKKWLQQNDSITVGLFPYYPPYQFINEQNEVDGVFIDYFELIEQKINYKFKKKRYDEWPILLQDLKDNKINLTLEIQETQNRTPYLKFYTPLFKSQHVIVTRKNDSFGNKIEDLNNKTIVVPQDYAITENLQLSYPEFNIITFKNELVCLQKLNAGEFDAYIGPRAVANYFIRSGKLNNLKLNSGIDFFYEPGLGINTSNDILDGIISKAINNITKEEKESILNNWFYVNVVSFYQTPKFWILVVLITLLLFIIGASFNAYLKFKIKQRTEELLIAKDIAEESNRLKTNFIKNIPQEIRTPMNGIIGLSEFLNDEGISTEQRKKFTQMIIGNSKELLSIIDNILEISQLQTKRFTLRLVEIDLQSTFQTILSYYEIKAKEKNIKLEVENNISDHQNLVLMDRSKLNKVLNVLVDNAIKYTEKGSVTISYTIENDFLCISIKDTGIGIPEKKQHHIKESLASTSENPTSEYKGLGLGLTIAKKNADFIGAEINLKSNNHGTNFRVKLPYHPVHQHPSGIANNEKKKEPKAEKHIILIAEDGETNFLFLKTILTKMVDYDFMIYRAKNGKEAVTICQENENIDLVLMDIKMPIMDGYDATKYIKKMRPDLPIIAQTAYSIEDDIQKALDAGCDDFVSKPVDRKVLKPILNKYFTAFKNKRNKVINSK
ncbi:response regulator [Aquimarina sp. 2201CG14-23]|uniref:response regulator n=1 Tax=Aquimarina mycalae TaxID=3040073 RepID=UPI002477CD3B|nr:transporter substrate-binding domain-containing protein [Aquimarina sp. 2201CG14-23]MDH7447155.1 transporter substrate-binding domain-containing protein [Aquimarina sp. 2201CG14-23]